MSSGSLTEIETYGVERIPDADPPRRPSTCSGSPSAAPTRSRRACWRLPILFGLVLARPGRQRCSGWWRGR
ncbi:hypothetical protein [Nonomuraea rubra]|uniref:hypothetical protein n=1 Tax=Nonomuraea rubra TaxID=46180 RepID=UPI0031E862D3